MDSAASNAAPVGVVSSIWTSRPYDGIPSRRRTVAGAGLGSQPCALRTVPDSRCHGGGAHLVDPEDLECGGRPDDIDDRIVPTYLVEVDLVDGPTVQAGFHRSQLAEDGLRPRRDPGRQGGLLYQGRR